MTKTSLKNTRENWSGWTGWWLQNPDVMNPTHIISLYYEHLRTSDSFPLPSPCIPQHFHLLGLRITRHLSHLTAHYTRLLLGPVDDLSRDTCRVCYLHHSVSRRSMVNSDQPQPRPSPGLQINTSHRSTLSGHRSATVLRKSVMNTPDLGNRVFIHVVFLMVSLKWLTKIVRNLMDRNCTFLRFNNCSTLIYS